MPKIREVLPKYLQIAGHIREKITRGDLVPGDEVPSERALAESWSVARPTAAKALEALRVQGLVESRQGSGTYVRSVDSAVRAHERYARARQLGTMYSPNESLELLCSDVVDGPEFVTDALRLAPSSRVIRRVRLLRDDKRPIELSTSWFAGELTDQAPLLLVAERLRGGTGKYIADITGRESTYTRDKACARLATEPESRLLELSSPSAVLVYHSTVYDPDDHPIQFDEAVSPPHRWVLQQEIPIPR